MNGELAALIALSLHGNDWLASESRAAPDLDTANSAFQYVATVQATSPQRRLLGTRTWTAEGVAAWLRFVKDTKARRLYLVIGGSPSSGLPDPVAASFANGGRWALVSDGSTPRLWRSQWAVQDRNRPDQRIWAVRLIGDPLRRPWRAEPPASLSVARDDLRSALETIRAFAERAELTTWAAWFGEALDLLAAPEPLIPYNPDLAPATISVESRQLLAAAVKAWVFGGMGSWNDLGFDDEALQAEYAQRTGVLYGSVLAAFVAVAGVPLRRAE